MRPDLGAYMSFFLSSTGLISLDFGGGGGGNGGGGGVGNFCNTKVDHSLPPFLSICDALCTVGGTTGAPLIDMIEQHVPASEDSDALPVSGKWWFRLGADESHCTTKTFFGPLGPSRRTLL
tara:strand:- start:343 stop:705 length:363 start_codon:yes stop_codon:yes gene_type:complete